jgi:hypothetical protein
MSWAATAWSYFAPGVGVNPNTGLHFATIQYHCFTDWDVASYIMSIIYAYKLGLITASGTWQFNDRITRIMTFLMNRPLMSSDSPYDFYSSDAINPYEVCPGYQNTPTGPADTGRLLSALWILESVTSAYDSDVTAIMARAVSTYDEFASTCCNGADYYQYLVGEGYQAFGYQGCNPCGVFSAVDSYAGSYTNVDGQNLPDINSLAEPLNLEILLGAYTVQPPSSTFLDFANRVYSVQYYNWTQTGDLTAWTEGVYPPPIYSGAYIYEWVLLHNLVGTQYYWQPWKLTGPGYSAQGSSGGPPTNSPVLAFTKTAFSYLAIYGSNAYTDALVNAVSKLASSTGFGEATYQNGQSAESLWNPTTGFYSDKTQEQVLEAAFYAITHSSTFVSFSSISSVVSAAAGSAWIVLPDFTAGESGSMHTSAGKCGGHVSALATDVYAATYFFGALTNPQQNEVLDTNSAYVSQSSGSCGQPGTSTSQPLVAVAGPVVNEVVGYYESVQATSPLWYNPGTGCIVNRNTGASVDCSTPTATNDVFVMEAFMDASGRTVFITYGRQWGGTLAGFEYVVNFVLKNPSSYTASWYVYSWQDATSGPSANGIPDPGDTYTQIATGP